MKLNKNHIMVKRLQNEANVFIFAQRLKRINIPFINVSFEYKEPKDTLSVGKLYVVFELHKWAGKIVNHGVTGLKCIHYWKVTDNNTMNIAMLYN